MQNIYNIDTHKHMCVCIYIYLTPTPTDFPAQGKRCDFLKPR